MNEYEFLFLKKQYHELCGRQNLAFSPVVFDSHCGPLDCLYRLIGGAAKGGGRKQM